MVQIYWKNYFCQIKYTQDHELGLYLGNELLTLVNISDYHFFPLGKDEIAVKNYSENKGVLNALICQGILKKTGKIHYQGFVSIPICKILIPKTV